MNSNTLVDTKSPLVTIYKMCYCITVDKTLV